MILSLPYSSKQFKLSKFTFNNSIELARLYDNNNDQGIIQYLEEIFAIQDLNIIDRLFVLLRAREIYYGEYLSLNIKSASVNIPIKRLYNALFSVTSCNRVLEHDGVSVELDIPAEFIIDDGDPCSSSGIISAVISKITIDNETLNFRSQPQLIKDTILRTLPYTFFNVIRDYIKSTPYTLTLSEAKPSIDLKAININFMSKDPAEFIKLIFNVYSLNDCREIIFILSRRLGGDIVLNSPPIDIKFYLEELDRERSRESGNPQPTI